MALRAAAETTYILPSCAWCHILSLPWHLQPKLYVHNTYHTVSHVFCWVTGRFVNENKWVDENEQKLLGRRKEWMNRREEGHRRIQRKGWGRDEEEERKWRWEWDEWWCGRREWIMWKYTKKERVKELLYVKREKFSKIWTKTMINDERLCINLSPSHTYPVS